MAPGVSKLLDHTKPQLDTPFKNPSEDVTEIVVTDPTHPLFGRRFPVRSISAPERGGIYVLVLYRDIFTLRIPLSASNLAPPRSASFTKLTCDSVAHLTTLAEQCEAVCPPDPQTSGDNCRPSSNS